MTKPKSRYPVESFGPELMAVLLKGSREKVILRFEGPDGEGKRRAHSFHRRIHTLRSKMREENHPDHALAARALCSIYWGARAVTEGAPTSWAPDFSGRMGALIVIRPRDSEFDDVLKQAGVEVAPRAEPETYVSKPSADEQAALDELVDDLYGLHKENPSEDGSEV